MIMNQENIPVILEEISQRWRGKEGNLIMILHDIQSQFGYVPREVCLELSKYIDVPVAQFYEVLTFYHYFKLTPPGKHNISVCMGTACYLNGAPALVNEFEHLLGIVPGETTPDGQFHIETVRCLGCCGLAPVITVDSKVYSGVKKTQIAKILSKYSAEPAALPAGETK